MTAREHSCRTAGCRDSVCSSQVWASEGSGAIANVSYACPSEQSARLIVTFPLMATMPLQHSAVFAQRAPAPLTFAAGQFRVVVSAPPYGSLAPAVPPRGTPLAAEGPP